MKSLLVIHFVMGPLMLIIAVLTKIFPPRKINWFYGYRTRRSMQSQEAWIEANTYSSNALIVVGLSASFFQLITYTLFDVETSLLLSATFLIIGLFLGIFFTEHHLKRKGYK